MDAASPTCSQYYRKELKMFKKIPVGYWIQQSIELGTHRFDTQLHCFSETISIFLEKITDAMTSLPPWAVAASLGAMVFVMTRNWKRSALSILGLHLIINLGFWQETLETLLLVLASTFIASLFGIPIGIYMAHHKWLYQIITPGLDFMQTIPTFVYLIPTLMLFGLGVVPGIISTVIFTMPASIRMTQLGISQVSASLTEVSHAFGATSWQNLIYIELPGALKTIRAGVSQCLMLSLSMVVIAAMVGADGLGKPVVQALNTVNIAKGFEAGISIVIVAIYLNNLVSERIQRPS